MNIGIDLDGVIANVIPELVIRLGKLGIKSNPEEWTSMYVEERHPELPDGWASQQFQDPVFFLNAMADESAFYCINRWFYSGDDIFIVTCRPNELRDVTERWLDEWGIPYNQLIMGAKRHAKFEILQENNCVVMIEDDGKEADNAAANGINSYLRLHPYNRSYKFKNRVYRVSDMYNVYNYLLERSV
jgi:uncharacterized HAD superfamily protein